MHANEFFFHLTGSGDKDCEAKDMDSLKFNFLNVLSLKQLS